MGGMKNPRDFNGIPNMEMPAALRDMTEKSLITCRDSFEQLKANAERTNAAIGRTFQHAGKGITDCNMKVIEALHSSVTSNFDFYRSLLQARGPTEVAEISSAHVRKQFEAATTLAKEMTALAQGIATESMKAAKGGS